MTVVAERPTRVFKQHLSMGNVQSASPHEEYPPMEDRSPNHWPEWQAMIRQLPFVVPEAVVSDLCATTPAEAFRTLLGALVEAGVIPETQQDAAFAALLRREALASTGVGYGVALPHIQLNSVNKVSAAVGYSRSGIDFLSVDGQPVHLIVLIVSPPHKSTEYLQALQTIAGVVRCQQERSGSSPA